MVITKKCSDAVMCVLPSDHYILDEDKFRQILDKAFIVARKTDKLITVGVKPTFPSTGYGYICYDPNNSIFDDSYEVESFIEKPHIEKAMEYVKSGNYLWNSGMFIWKASTILDNLNRYLPKLYKTMSKVREFIGTDKEKAAIESIYPELQSISIDFGIMERSDDVLVIPGDFGWNDIGRWDALGAIFPGDENGNIIKANHIGLNTKNSIIYSENRLITTIGLENLIIADTEDAILICPKNKAQEVKNLVELIKKNGMEEYI